MLFYELTIVKSKREYNILSRWEFMFIDAFINFFFFCLFVCFSVPSLSMPNRLIKTSCVINWQAETL